PEVASLLSGNPQLKPVGLFDAPLHYAARKLRLAVDTGYSFLGSVYKTLGAAVEGFDSLSSMLVPHKGRGRDVRLLEGVSSGLMEPGEAAYEARSVEAIFAAGRLRLQGNRFDPS